MEKTLHLTLKKRWFDMIASGKKKEEYREIKMFWKRRLLMMDGEGSVYFRTYDTVVFTHGYASNAPQITLECKGIETGTAKPEWSDNWKGRVFIIKLGNILTK